MRLKYRLALVTLSLLFIGGDAFAQSGKLTLKECRSMAIENNKRLRNSAEKIESSKDMLKAYKTNNLPNLSLKGGFLYSPISFTQAIKGGYLPTFTPNPATGEMIPNISGMAPDGTPIFKEYAYMPDINFELEVGAVFTGSLVLAQPIYMGRKIANSIKLANIGVSAAELAQKKAEHEIIGEADKAFYTYLKVQDMLLSAQKYRAVVAEFYRQMGNGYESGMKRKNDLMKVKVRLNEAELLVRKAENGVRLSRMNLCYVIGLPLTSMELEVEDSFDNESIIADKSLDITARPEYELLNKQIEAKELEVKIARSKFLPSIAGVVSYGYVNGVTLNDNTLFNNVGFNAGVTLSVPIFHWREGKNTVSAKKREVNIAKNDKEDFSQLMTLELLQAINSYDESLLEAELASESVAQAEENMRLSKNQYEAGMETLAYYLESQALWQKAMSDLTESRAAQRIAYTNYLRCRGEME